MNLTRKVLLKSIGIAALAFLFLMVVPGTEKRVDAEELIPIYRLYYRPSHEHLYTKDIQEVEVLTQQHAWVYEGIGWMASAEGAPVYRLFYPGTGEHLYTADQNEYNALPARGWQQEGICWYSDADEAVPVYRLYSPALTIGAHHYTIDANERKVLLASGMWQDEGIAWYADNGGQPAPDQAPAELAVENISYENGAFDLVVRNASAPGGVFKVFFAVANTADGGNIQWYEAYPQRDKSWRATVGYDKFQAARGQYHAIAFVTGGDGVATQVGETMVDDPFRDVIIDPMIRRARDYINAVTTPDMSNEQKLRVCFDSFKSAQMYNPWIPHYHGADWTVRYGNFYFDNRAGNCYAYASAFAYIAKALGYENVCVCSGITHGWVEINGLTYDPQLAKKYSDVSYYGMAPGVFGMENYYRQMSAGMPNNRIWL